MSRACSQHARLEQAPWIGGTALQFYCGRHAGCGAMLTLRYCQKCDISLESHPARLERWVLPRDHFSNRYRRRPPIGVPVQQLCLDSRCLHPAIVQFEDVLVPRNHHRIAFYTSATIRTRQAAKTRFPPSPREERRTASTTTVGTRGDRQMEASPGAELPLGSTLGYVEFPPTLLASQPDDWYPRGQAKAGPRAISTWRNPVGVSIENIPTLPTGQRNTRSFTSLVAWTRTVTATTLYKLARSSLESDITGGAGPCHTPTPRLPGTRTRAEPRALARQRWLITPATLLTSQCWPRLSKRTPITLARAKSLITAAPRPLKWPRTASTDKCPQRPRRYSPLRCASTSGRAISTESGRELRSSRSETRATLFTWAIEVLTPGRCKASPTTEASLTTSLSHPERSTTPGAITIKPVLSLRRPIAGLRAVAPPARRNLTLSQAERRTATSAHTFNLRLASHPLTRSRAESRTPSHQRAALLAWSLHILICLHTSIIAKSVTTR
jgi:hypothetical protein